MIVHLICKVGPEWCTPIEAWHNRRAAEFKSRALDLELDKTDVFDGLSKHEVFKIEIKDVK